MIFDHELRPAVLEEAYLDRVARYVEKGGALLIAAGPPYPGAYMLYNTPLGGVLPGRATGEMVDGKFTPQLTDARQAPLRHRHAAHRRLGPVDALHEDGTAAMPKR